MNITTKYSCGDTVRKIFRAPMKTWIPCGFCSETGEIIGANGDGRRCPECYGNLGEYEYGLAEWQLDDKLYTIGQVRAEYTVKSHGAGIPSSNFGAQKEALKIQYMCYQTGIGSGNVHDEEDFFLSTDEAVAEIAKRNGSS